MNRYLCCLSVLLLSAWPTLGDTPISQPSPDDANPEKIVAASMEAARKGEWDRYADLLHPESFDDYKRMWTPILEAAAARGEEQVAAVVPLFDKAKDLKTVLALQPREFFISSMKGLAITQTRDRQSGLVPAEGKIIGTVREGENSAYVVVRNRQRYGEAEWTRMEVVALKRSGTAWKILLPDTVRVLADSWHRAGLAAPRKWSFDGNIPPERR
jgi:hypothetical protein